MRNAIPQRFRAAATTRWRAPAIAGVIVPRAIIAAHPAQECSTPWEVVHRAWGLDTACGARPAPPHGKSAPSQRTHLCLHIMSHMALLEVDCEGNTDLTIHIVVHVVCLCSHNSVRLKACMCVVIAMMSRCVRTRSSLRAHKQELFHDGGT